MAKFSQHRTQVQVRKQTRNTQQIQIKKVYCQEVSISSSAGLAKALGRSAQNTNRNMQATGCGVFPNRQGSVATLANK